MTHKREPTKDLLHKDFEILILLVIAEEDNIGPSKLEVVMDFPFSDDSGKVVIYRVRPT